LGVAVDVAPRRMTFMDSSGVAMLARLASQTPARLRFIAPPDLVRFLLRVIHLGYAVDILDIDPGFPDDCQRRTTPHPPTHLLGAHRLT
jgi:anti-sigma B factor antagonist